MLPMIVIDICAMHIPVKLKYSEGEKKNKDPNPSLNTGKFLCILIPLAMDSED